jgi:thiamine-monophosphate kinase
VLAGGDDYELVFTAPPAMRDRIRQAGAQGGVATTRIGRITAERGLRVVDAGGRPLDIHAARSFDHFAY